MFWFVTFFPVKSFCQVKTNKPPYVSDEELIFAGHLSSSEYNYRSFVIFLNVGLL